jgi:hypothetical protein
VVAQPRAGALPQCNPVADHRHACPRAGRGDGSNGSRVRLWKRELQKLANKLGLDIVVSHLPPGTSKWNKIEHPLFSFISQNWRAQPLVSYRVIVELISATTTKTGLTVRCELDTGRRVELHHFTEYSSAKLRVHFLTPLAARGAFVRSGSGRCGI